MLTKQSKKLVDTLHKLTHDINHDKQILLVLFNHLKKVSLLPFHVTDYSTTKHVEPPEISSSEEIGDKISEFCKKSREVMIRCSIGKTIVTVRIIYENIKDMKSFSKQMFFILQYMISITDCHLEELNIVFYLLDYPKQLPETWIETLSTPQKHHVNSGMCATLNHSSTIHIWRKQEIMKVFIHEMIHALSLDVIPTPEIIHNHYLEKYGNQLTIIQIREAYTEIWAEIINCFLISQVHEDPRQQFNDMLHTECIFANIQFIKMKYLLDNDIDINKYTRCLSYYVIKYEIYRKLSTFITLCRIHNLDYINSKNEWFIQFLLDNLGIDDKNISLQEIKKKKQLLTTVNMSPHDYDLFNYEYKHPPY